jgi:prevent-host-death family protein
MPWQVQEAKARFSEFLDASLREGPQVVTRRGIEVAVLVPIVRVAPPAACGSPHTQEAPAIASCPVRDFDS